MVQGRHRDAARALYQSAEFFTEFDQGFSELMDNIQKAIDRVTDLGSILKNGPPKDEGGTPKAGVGRALKALKVLEYVAIGAKVARYSLKVSHALLPSHISEFYVDIGNQKRLPGSPAVTIQPGNETPFSVFIMPQSAGWQESISRETIIKQAVDSIWSLYAGLRKLPDPDAGKRRIEEVNNIVQLIKQRFPAVASFLGVEYVFTLIEKKEYRAFEINDTRLVTIKSNSLAHIEFTPKPPNAIDDKPFILKGTQPTAPGMTAGYVFELTDYTVVQGLPTVREMVQASNVPIKVLGEVIVGKPPTPGAPSASPYFTDAKGQCRWKSNPARFCTQSEKE